MMQTSFGAFPSENHLISPVQEPGDFSYSGGVFMKTGLTKKQKVTELFYNAKEPMAEIYTHDTALKKRLLSYAAKYPELCKQTDDDGQGGLWFELDKSRVSIRLTAPYSDSRKEKLAREARRENLIKGKENEKFEV